MDLLYYFLNTMIRNVLESIAGAEVFAVFSLVLFVAVFCTMLLLVFKANKQYLNRMANMPLDDETMIKSSWQADNLTHRT